MENLLNEHPSMSVYAVHSSCPGLSEASCVNDDYNPSSPRYAASTLVSATQYKAKALEDRSVTVLEMYLSSMVRAINAA